MSDLLPLAAAGLAGYLVGAIPVGLMLARTFGLGDVRKIGSGNIGASNVLRTGNRLAALLTLLLDAAKGAGPVLAAGLIWPGGDEAAAIAGLGAFLGHCFSVYLGFWGGKGVATGFGVFMAWSWGIGLICALVWLAAALVTRRASAAALATTAAALVLFGLWGDSLFFAGAAVMSAVLIWRHRENIERLRAGEEPQISLGGNRAPKGGAE
ncbi:MAG: glycerol-3-phosphate 1-O-acyltransferase PlsY [Pseudomonadota bacterium]